jgi:hypothetical protein
MAVNFTTIKNTNQETIIHFESPATVQNGTITIADLTAATEVRNSDTPKVNIVRLVASGEDGSTLLIQRDGKTVLVCAPENAPMIDLPSFGISDNQKNDKDIVFQNQTEKQISGYITLRKVQGWSTKVETATYGSYDNPSASGS